MTIVKLKKPKVKSDADVMGVLLGALKEARENKVTSVTVTLVTKEYTYSTYAVTKDATFTETIGAVEKLKDKIMCRWREL